MHFVLQTPSLQHLAGVKIVAQLWNQRDNFTQMSRLDLLGFASKKEAIEERVKIKVRALPLPELCKKQLLTLITPLRMEIIAWCSYHCEGKVNFKFLENMLPQQLCWTMHGSIDYGETAESMVKDKRLDVERRYEIACLNCLENEARKLLGSNMTGKQRLEYVNTVRNVWSSEHHHLIVFFTCTFISDLDHLRKYFQPMISPNHSSLNECLFEEMLPSGNRATCEYLFTKLNQREKEQVFRNCGNIIHDQRHSSSTPSILFYLSMMNAEQQEGVIRQCIGDLLICLLRWPLQPVFVEAAECGWQFMENYAPTELFRAILLKVSSGCRDYDYLQLFWKCWRLSSAEYKRILFGGFEIVDSLIQTKEEECIKLILNEAPSTLIYPLCRTNSKYKRVLVDVNVISDAALMDCKEKAALNCSKDQDNEEKQLISKYIRLLVDNLMESRIQSRSHRVCWPS